MIVYCSISAMYNGKRLVVGFVAAAFCVEFGTNAWLLSNGIRESLIYTARPD